MCMHMHMCANTTQLSHISTPSRQDVYELGASSQGECRAPPDGKFCPVGTFRQGVRTGGDPEQCRKTDDVPTFGEPFCDAKLLKTCTGSWSCLAYDATDGTTVLTSGDDCWFPRLSPLGLVLASDKNPSEVLDPDAQAEFERQCKQPPFLFAYDAGSVVESDVVEPTRFGCDVPDDSAGVASPSPPNRKWIYDDTLGSPESTPMEDRTRRWNEVCGDIFWAQGEYDWATLLAADVAPTSVLECKGNGGCLKKSADGQVPACTARTDGPGEGVTVCPICDPENESCLFHPPYYSNVLVYSSGLRTEDVWGLEDPAERAKLLTQMSTMLNQYASASSSWMCEHYPSGPGCLYNGGKMLAQTQAMVLETMATTLAAMPDAGYVPAFNSNFFNKQLEQYTKELRDLVKELEKTAESEATLKLFVEYLDLLSDRAAWRTERDRTGKRADRLVHPERAERNACRPIRAQGAKRNHDTGSGRLRRSSRGVLPAVENHADHRDHAGLRLACDGGSERHLRSNGFL